MTLKLKKNISFTGVVEEAARLRLTENPDNRYKESDLDSIVSGYISRGLLTTTPRLAAGESFNSSDYTTFVKDTKFLMALNNIQLRELDREISFLSKSSQSYLQNIEQELMGLSSRLLEEETKQKENYSTVHFNSFTRSLDQSLGSQNSLWLTDFKTSGSFLPEHECEVCEEA